MNDCPRPQNYYGLDWQYIEKNGTTTHFENQIEVLMLMCFVLRFPLSVTSLVFSNFCFDPPFSPPHSSKKKAAGNRRSRI